jgi:outer membrane protein assembly factor BamB
MRKRPVTLAIVGAAAAVAAAVCAAGPHAGAQQVPPSVAALPRMRRLWMVDGLAVDRTRQELPNAPGGLLVARTATDSGRSLVLLDIASGRERWRAPLPDRRPAEGDFIADALLVQADDGTVTAFDIATGRMRWTRNTGCTFPLRLDGRGKLAVGVCSPTRPPRPKVETPDKMARVRQEKVALALDLGDGHERWRVRAAEATAIAVGARAVYFVGGSGMPGAGREVQRLDRDTGALLGATRLPAGVVRVAPDFGGRDLVLGYSGDGAAVLRASDGQLLWQDGWGRFWGSPGYGVQVREGRLLVARGGDVIDIDLETGQRAASWTVPHIDNQVRSQAVRWMRGKLVVAFDAWNGAPALVARYERPGASPALVAAPVGFASAVALDAGVLVVRRGTSLEGYSVFDTVTPEAVALAASDRVRASLERNERWFERDMSGFAPGQAALNELRAVPGYASELVAIAADRAAPLRDAATDAGLLLRAPGIARVVLSELDATPLPPPPPPPATANERDFAVALKYQQAFTRRTNRLVLLAALDDIAVAPRLASMLAARNRDAAGEPRIALTTCTAAPAGRSEGRAAIYRMLARLAGPSDLAALDALDAADSGAGGWSRICAADDANAAATPPRVVGDGWGLCKGIDVGGYRVTQAGAIWLRRRLPDGSLSPPAWALDPGGKGTDVDFVRVKAAELRGQRIVVTGDQVALMSGGPLTAEIDPAAVFADRDADGLPDLTEAAFGTDPGKADSDGDGVPDGRDPSPGAAPPADDAGRLRREIIRYAARFLSGNPIVVYAERPSWTDADIGAGLIVYRAPPPPAAGAARWPLCDIVDCGGAHEHPSVTMGGPRLCASPLVLDGLEIARNEARAVVAWSVQHGRAAAHRLRLRRVRGAWRVIGDEEASELLR